MRIVKKILKYLLYTVVVLLVVANVFILVTGRTYIYRAVYYTYLHGQTTPGIFDKDYFYARTIKRGEPQPWAYHKNFNTTNVPADVAATADTYGTTGFLVVKNDSILCEGYWDNTNEKTVTNSFSVAKSVVALLAGCAIQDGKIKSLDQPVKDFLPWIKEEAGTVTIRHLMAMSSGMEWNESAGNPLSDNAEAYYGTGIEDHIKRISYTQKPGEQFIYKSGNTEVLAMAISKATGKNISEYASEKLWKPMGASHDAYWSLDHDNGLEKAYCCIYTTLHDFARFGKLMLHHGKWNNTKILDSTFVHECITPSAASDENGEKNTRYGLGWWMLNYKNTDVFYMRGILGQYVICIPSENVIIVRVGHRRGEKINDLPQDLLLYIDAGLRLARKN